MNIFFTSDHHWFHDNILKFTDRGFSTLEEMHSEYIKRWNKVVKVGDTTYIIGDNVWNTVGMNKYKELMDKLNGQKILIEGNHDRVKALSASKLGLTAIIQSAVIKLGKTEILLSHYPYKYGFWKGLVTNIKNYFTKGYWPSKNRYTNYPENKGLFLLHGHHHNGDITHGKQFNVAWDIHKRPINIQEIESFIQKNP